MRTRAAVLAAVLLAVLAPQPAHAGTATGPRLAFTARLHGSWQVFTTQPNGTGLRQVTHIRGSDDVNLYQNWSPDGRQLVYSSTTAGSADLYVVNADGTGTRQITSGPADDLVPSWSPDGRHLLFARVSNGQTAAIYRSDADGAHLVRLTSPAYDSFAPQYTPDGRSIVFESSRGGLVAAVWRMKADGTGAHRLTPAAMQARPWDISPDGTRILLSDNENSAKATALYDMDLDGTHLRRLTSAGCCIHDGGARYSPDGRTIAFTTDRAYVPLDRRELEVWEMTSNGRDLHPVTSSLTPGGCPDELVGNCVGAADWRGAVPGGG